MESRGPEARELRVGEWWVRPLQNEVENGETCVRLEARSIEVLLCLACHAPAVVSKETILDEVWGDVAVGDEVISHAIWELRKAFGDNAKRPDYIRTIPKKGYALVAEVFWSVLGVEPQVGTAVGPYRLEEEIGRGAMGVVYRATDTRLDRTVAIKFLAAELTRDAEAVRRFEREARLAASLDHPNLAPVFEVGEMSGGRQFLVTAYCAGGTLRDRLKEGVLAPREALEIVQQIARGLAVAHKKDIIHRDVKPANILFNEDGTARLVDFGIAKLASSTSLTRTGHSLGTPAYKSPEQSRGHETDHRTDIWSLGVVLYECLTAKRPFSGSYDHAVVRSILEDEPDLALSLPADQSLPGLEGILRKALSKDPSERFQSAGELVAEVEDCLGRGPALEPYRRPPWYSGAAVSISVALLALMVIVASGYVDQGQGAMPEFEAKVQKKVVALLEEGWDATMDGRGVEGTELARKSFEEALERDHDNPKAIGALAYSLTLSLRDQDADRTARERAVRLIGQARDASLEHGLLLLAEARLAMIDEKRRLQALEEAGEMPPPELRYRDALRLARRAINTFDDGDRNADLGFIVLGRAQELATLTEEAEGAYQRAIGLGRGSIRGRESLAWLHWNQGRWEEAAATYKRIFDEHPEHHPTLNNLGVLYVEAGLPDEAELWFNRAEVVRPSVRGLSNLGAMSFYRGAVEKAEGYFQRALGVDPDAAVALHGLGDCYAKLGRRDEARRLWRQAADEYDVDTGREEEKDRRRAERAVTLAKLLECEAISEEPFLLEPLGKVSASLLFSRAQVNALCRERHLVYAAVAAARSGGQFPAAWFRIDPCFEEFQGDPEFEAALLGVE